MSKPYSPDWAEDSLKWRGEILDGKYAHWCFDWDELPMDETCIEWPCACAKELIQNHWGWFWYPVWFFYANVGNKANREMRRIHGR